MTISRFSYPLAQHCDARPSGERAVAFHGDYPGLPHNPDARLETHLGRIDLPGEDVLDIRITQRGPFKMTGIGHISGAAWLWADGKWTENGPTNGRSACIFDNDGNLWVVRPGPNVTSQGYRYVDDAGALVSGDSTYTLVAPDGLMIHEFSTLAGVTFGQGHESGTHVLIEGKRRLLEPGLTTFIRIGSNTQGLFSVALVKPGEAVLLWATREDLAALDLVTPDKPVDPDKPTDPTKPTEKPPMQLPARGQAIVQALYSAHLDWANSPDDDERRKLARAIAEQLRFELGEEWGWKSAHGNTDRDAPSKDAVAHRRGPYVGGHQLLDIFDLFNGTTRQPNNPAMSGPENEADQFFVPVDPIDHLGGGPVVIPPDKPTDPALAAQVAALTARVDALTARSQTLEMADGTQVAAIAGLDARLSKLEKGGTGPALPTGVPSAKDIIDELVKRLKAMAA